MWQTFTVSKTTIDAGIQGAIAYHGGNSNNDANVGTWYLNLNNTASNTNWNIGAAHSWLATSNHELCPRSHMTTKCPLSPRPLGQNELDVIAAASNLAWRKWLRG